MYKNLLKNYYVQKIYNKIMVKNNVLGKIDGKINDVIDILNYTKEGIHLDTIKKFFIY
jgi:hypothetical protein